MSKTLKITYDGKLIYEFTFALKDLHISESLDSWERYNLIFDAYVAMGGAEFTLDQFADVENEIDKEGFDTHNFLVQVL